MFLPINETIAIAIAGLLAGAGLTLNLQIMLREFRTPESMPTAMPNAVRETRPVVALPEAA